MCRHSTTWGVMYLKGRGVPEDAAQSVQWFRLAAKQGMQKAQHGLGMLYGQGLGVKEDLVRAYLWLSLGPRGGRSGVGQIPGSDQEKSDSAAICHRIKDDVSVQNTQVPGLRLTHEACLNTTLAERPVFFDCRGGRRCCHVGCKTGHSWASAPAAVTTVTAKVNLRR